MKKKYKLNQLDKHFLPVFLKEVYVNLTKGSYMPTHSYIQNHIIKRTHDTSNS